MRWCLVFLFSLCTVGAAYGEVPLKMHYQGFLTDSVGTPYHCDLESCDEPLVLTFRLYEQAAGGESLWLETHANVVVEQGVFHVVLGTNEALSDDLVNGSRYLGVEVNTQGEMFPRQQMVSSPFSLRAAMADYAETAADATHLGGVAVEQFVQTSQTEDFLTAADLLATLEALGYAPEIAWQDLTGIPADLADGDDDTQLTEVQVDGFVGDNGYAFDLALNNEIADRQEADTGLQADIAVVQGNVDTVQGNVDIVQGNVDIVQANVDTVQANVDAVDARVDGVDVEILALGGAIGTVQGNIDVVQANVDAVGADLSALDGSLDPIAKDGLPAELADGDDDTLASLVCAESELTRWDAELGTWICSTDSDTQVSEEAVEDFITNGAIDLAAGTTLDGAIIATGGAVPIGGIIMWSGSVTDIPSDWALCDGAAGTPDLTNRFIRGIASASDAPGELGGADTQVLLEAHMPSHTHDVNDPNHSHATTRVCTSGGTTGLTGVATASPCGSLGTNSSSTGISLGSAGSGSGFDNRPAFYTLAFIIKL